MRKSNIRYTVSTDQSRLRPLLRRVDLDLLELFDCVYRTRNLSAAGARLGLSQPAVSRGLVRLRDAYDDALFVRQQRGVLPTPFADHLAEPFAAALAIIRGTVDRPGFDPATARRGFRIALSDIGERFFLPALLRHLVRAAPGIAIETVGPALPELVGGLTSGEVNLVAGFLPALGKQFHQQRLFRERFVYIVREGHPLVRGRLTKERLRALPHVVVSPLGTPHASAVDRVLASPGMRAPIALRVRSFLSVAPIVADSDLVAPIPGNLAAIVADALRLQRIDPPVHFPGFDVAMAWHRRYHNDPATQWLRGVFAELFDQRRHFSPPR